MIDSILEWINGGRSHDRPDELQLAVAALLVEAAYIDGHFEQAERAVIARLIESRFQLRGTEAQILLAAAERTASQSAELFHFTRIINERLSFEERVKLIEMLWEVAYADRVLDQSQDSLLRRIGGLIYVPDKERGMARQRVLKRLGLEEVG